MTQAEVFSYVLRMKGGERAARILALMDERERAEVTAAMQGLDHVSSGEVREKWSEERRAEERLKLKGLKQQMNFDEVRLPPEMVKWILRTF